MKKFKRIMIITLSIIGILLLGMFLFMQQAVFGKKPTGDRLTLMKQSPNYKNDAFQNINPTTVSVEGVSMASLMIDFLNKPQNTEPTQPLPFVKTNLNQLPKEKTSVVWFGHSSYLIHSNGINVLVDPVFSDNAAPISMFAKAFEGSNTYKAADMPPIDVLIITHDHYDHLDYNTIVQLKHKVKKIYTPLGVGSHLEHWDIPSDKIVEFDWWQHHKLSDSMELTAVPARHFSGRDFTRAKTLWSAFVLKIDDYKIFIGGDSGYDNHFKTIGEKYGPFDIAMLEAGQYGVNWPYIHMMPEETITAAQELRSKILMPVHWGKFALALHEWDEPIKRVVESAQEKNLPLTTPMIGEVVVLDSIYPQTQWWRENL